MGKTLRGKIIKKFNKDYSLKIGTIANGSGLQHGQVKKYIEGEADLCGENIDKILHFLRKYKKEKKKILKQKQPSE